MAQSSAFVLSTTGCSKKHCSQAEDDAVDFGVPCATMSSGCGGTGQSLAQYAMPNGWPNPVTGNDGKSDGCSGNTLIVACKSQSHPHLRVFANDGHMLYNSCGQQGASNTTNCPLNSNNTTTDIFPGAGKSIGTALVAETGNGTFDNAVIAADDNSVVVFPYSNPTQPLQTVYSSVTSMSVTGLIPQGIIYTTAPGPSGSTVALVTLMFQNGPLMTFNIANIGNQSQNYGYVDSQYIGGLPTACRDNSQINCYYAGTNSAGAAQVVDSNGNPHGRIYAVVNNYPANQNNPLTQKEQYYGRLYALNIDATGAQAGINVDWYYDFVRDGNIVGPSRASPMVSPNGGVFTDYASTDQAGDPCSTANSPTGSCGAGVLGIIDCDVTPRPAACSAKGQMWYQIYQVALTALASDASPYTTGLEPTYPFINANFPYDYANQCFWVRQDSTATMSCLSDTSMKVVEAINTAFLAANPNNSNGWPQGPVSTGQHPWNDIYPESNVPMSKVPSGVQGAGDSLAIIGEHNGTSSTGILAIDTGVCGRSQTCCTPAGVQAGTGMSCTSSWSAQAEILWYFNLQAISGGQAEGQFTVLNGPATDTPCLLAFTDTKSTWFLSASDQANAGCGQDQ